MARIDLLYAEPALRVSLPIIERALVFAFSAGDTNNAFERVLERSGCGVTSFDPECFAQDLFVEQFVEQCLPIRVRGTKYAPCKPYLTRILTNPPEALGDTRFRQDLLNELNSSPTLRTAFEDLYVQLQQLRALLSAGDYGTRVDQNVRRLDVLKSVAGIFQTMANRFSDAYSGLVRIRDAGRRIVAGEPFAQLLQMLEHESNLGSVDVRVKLGFEGGVRSFDVLGYHENTSNPYYASLLARFFRKLVMLLRGYRLSHYELLTRLMDHSFDAIKPEVLPLFQLLGDMEFYLAGLGFADMAQAAGLEACFPELDPNEGSGFVTEALYNPFLLAQGVNIQPCNIDSPPGVMTIVTGPNSGGKTRLLQSVALCQLLGQAGLMVPARRAHLDWKHGLFVSLIDDVRADQREGRLGMELMRIRRLFERLNVGDMVVIDELCSGTNPSEGEEIFRLVIDLLGQLQPSLWLTTHFLQFAEHLQESAELPLLRFLQVRLDARDVPTFQFEPGVAKTSLARQTAARLGVTWDELTALVERAKARRERPRPRRSELPAAELGQANEPARAQAE